MDDRLVILVAPTPSETRLLARIGPDEVLKARLAPASQVHRWAAPMLIESLSLWYHARAYVVVSADVDAVSSDLGLCDGLGFGGRAVHYEVKWVDPRELRRRARRLRGVGDFRDVRRHLRLVVSR